MAMHHYSKDRVPVEGMPVKLSAGLVTVLLFLAETGAALAQSSALQVDVAMKEREIVSYTSMNIPDSFLAGKT